MPADRGPIAKPAVMATAARLPAAGGAASPKGGRDASRSQAVPALNAAPLLMPASRRPAKRNAGIWAPASRLMLAARDRAAEQDPGSGNPGPTCGYLGAQPARRGVTGQRGHRYLLRRVRSLNLKLSR